jgi:hypothetical protein
MNTVDCGGLCRFGWWWHSEVGHGAIDVVVAEGGEVQRDRRVLERDHPAGGDVEATADALAADATAGLVVDDGAGGDVQRALVVKATAGAGGVAADPAD